MLVLEQVVRDESGTVLQVAVKRYQARWLVSLAMGARFGMEVAKHHGFDAVELECDATTITKAIVRKKFGRSPLDLVIEDICLLGIVCLIFMFVMLNGEGIQ